MRPHPTLFVLLLFTLVLLPLSAAAQQPCERWNGQGLRLTGRFGGADVLVYLDTGWPSRAGDESGVSGLVLDRARWMASPDDGLLALDGRMLNGCRLELKELRGDAEWHLRIVSARRAEGTRADDGRSTPLAFTIVPPVDCTAGPWKTFANEAWPVTFEYPASARFGPGITIACPDVERLAWGAMPLTIESADFVKDESGGLRRVGPFLRDAAGRWHVGEDEECEARDKESRLCGPASETRWRGFTGTAGRIRRRGPPLPSWRRQLHRSGLRRHPLRVPAR